MVDVRIGQATSGTLFVVDSDNLGYFDEGETMYVSRVDGTRDENPDSTLDALHQLGIDEMKPGARLLYVQKTVMALASASLKADQGEFFRMQHRLHKSETLASNAFVKVYEPYVDEVSRRVCANSYATVKRALVTIIAELDGLGRTKNFQSRRFRERKRIADYCSTFQDYNYFKNWNAVVNAHTLAACTVGRRNLLRQATEKARAGDIVGIDKLERGKILSAQACKESVKRGVPDPNNTRFEALRTRACLNGLISLIENLEDRIAAKQHWSKLWGDADLAKECVQLLGSKVSRDVAARVQTIEQNVEQAEREYNAEVERYSRERLETPSTDDYDPDVDE